jgi:hypothetical protein
MPEAMGMMEAGLLINLAPVVVVGKARQVDRGSLGRPEKVEMELHHPYQEFRLFTEVAAGVDTRGFRVQVVPVAQVGLAVVATALFLLQILVL